MLRNMSLKMRLKGIKALSGAKAGSSRLKPWSGL
jgi:hypothetical protein